MISQLLVSQGILRVRWVVETVRVRDDGMQREPQRQADVLRAQEHDSGKRTGGKSPLVCRHFARIHENIFR